MCFDRLALVWPPFLAAVAWLALVPPARAEDSTALPPLLGTTERQGSHAGSGLGLSGYDAVSYFVESAPRPGDPRYETVWAGLAWRFASGADRAAFRRDPETFLPRVGGYDAVAAAEGRAVEADPLLFAIRAGHLYLFRTPENRDRFLAEPGSVEAAERGWSAILSGLVRD